MGKRKQVASDKSVTVTKLPEACCDEATAYTFMEAQRWPDGVACPKCGVIGEAYMMADRETNMRNKRFLWRCRACKRQFTVRVGTVFEDSRIPLRHWCYAFWAACASKKGVSALQIKRMTGLSYKSALFMMHRIRWAMTDAPGTPRPLEGTVEADETYIGGKPRHRKRSNIGSKEGKEQVMCMVERGGEARPVHVDRVSGMTIHTVLRQHVAKSARLMTDESRAYEKIGQGFAGGHEAVMHSVHEYVRGEAHTNTAEGFFALVKRGMYGTFHSVSKHRLPLYLAEFQFRYNTRAMDDGERTTQAIRRADGKRLMYRQPSAEDQQDV